MPYFRPVCPFSTPKAIIAHAAGALLHEDSLFALRDALETIDRERAEIDQLADELSRVKRRQWHQELDSLTATVQWDAKSPDIAGWFDWIREAAVKLGISDEAALSPLFVFVEHPSAEGCRKCIDLIKGLAEKAIASPGETPGSMSVSHEADRKPPDERNARPRPGGSPKPIKDPPACAREAYFQFVEAVGYEHIDDPVTPAIYVVAKEKASKQGITIDKDPQTWCTEVRSARRAIRASTERTE